MLEMPAADLESPATWIPLPPTPVQATALSRFALPVDDLSLTLRTWRAQAKCAQLLLPHAAPYPGHMASALRRITEHALKPLRPKSIEMAWLKCDDELPLSQSISDRGLSLAVLSLISDAMMAAGMAHAGQPLMGIDQPGVRAWLSEHQLMIRGPGQDALAATRICRALGLPAKVIRRCDTSQPLIDALLDSGAEFTEPMNSERVLQLKRQVSGPSSRVWWLDTTESFVALKGYACAALELKQQIFIQGIRPSLNRPLLVFVSSTNCLGAAGLIRGLKAVFGPYVQVVLVEDVHHLQALPTLCRWPKDSQGDRLVNHSEMGNKGLIGVVDAVITVSDEHRRRACLSLPPDAHRLVSSEAASLFAAASEHLRVRHGFDPHVVLWLSEQATS